MAAVEAVEKVLEIEWPLELGVAENLDYAWQTVLFLEMLSVVCPDHASIFFVSAS